MKGARFLACCLAAAVLCPLVLGCAPRAYSVYQYDNGDDYFEDGLRRIVNKHGEIGYADETGRVVIEPKYRCAHPFKNGRAQVAYDCAAISDGEHSLWISKNWFYIDKNGDRAAPPE